MSDEKTRHAGCWQYHISQPAGAGLLGFLLAGAAQLAGVANAAGLPVPCSAGSCGASGPLTWVTSGAATATATGNQLTINQSSNNAI